MSRSMTKYPMFAKLKSRCIEGKKRNQELNAFLDKYTKHEIDLELEDDFTFKQSSKLIVKSVKTWEFDEISRSMITRKLRKPYAMVIKNKPLKKFRIRKSLKRLPDERKVIACDKWIHELFFPKISDISSKYINHIKDFNIRAIKYGYNKPELTKAELMKLYDNIFKTYDELYHINYFDYKYKKEQSPQLRHMFVNNKWMEIFISKISYEKSGILKLHKYKKQILKQIVKSHNDLYNDYLKVNNDINKKYSEKEKCIYKYYIK